ncbi:hypothetical protein B0H13DRAFT_1947248 [Mycena leptocephala]|nr:hypothetical protein B0H13DRAFT_1947248 [Mycena leptocephala]
MQTCSPLDIQELLDHCVSFLPKSTPDLRACALVARSWLVVAQSHLFRAPHITQRAVKYSDRRLLRLHDTLLAAPHLLQHVRELAVEKDGDGCHVITETTFAKLCNLRFTHLKSASISVTEHLSIPLALALQQLLSTPTLCRLKLNMTLRHLSTFIQIWERCTSTLRHLDISVRMLATRPGTLLDRASIIPVCAAPIQLRSLRMAFWGTKGCDQRELYHSALCLFDLSQLRALAILDDMGVPWKEFAIPLIEVLDIEATENGDQIDLACFPNLLHLCLTLVESISPMVFAILSTIVPTHPIRTITISFNPPLDCMLATLPVEHPPAVTFEISVGWQEQAMKLFPGLISADRVRDGAAFVVID